MIDATKSRIPSLAWMTIAVGAVIVLGSCTQHTVRVEPVEVKPIHVTMDINLRVQKELQQFFDFEEQVTPQSSSSESSKGSKQPAETDSTDKKKTP